MRTILLAALLCSASPVVAQLSGDAGNLTREDAKVLSGQAFTVSTQVIAIASGNFLNASLTNNDPVRNMIMTSRVFSCGTVGLEYQRWSSASVLPTGTPITTTVNNRIQGGPIIPASFSYIANTNTFTGGTISSAGFVPGGAEEKRIKDIVIIPPGGKLNYALSMGGLAQTVRCAMTFLGYMN